MAIMGDHEIVQKLNHLLEINMESEIVTYKKITLVLEDLEALWLKALVQNELNEYEAKTDRRMRKIFWDALNKVSEE